MGIVYYRPRPVKFRCLARPRHPPFFSPRIKKLVVVGPVGSVENSRSEFSKRLWGTWVALSCGTLVPNRKRAGAAHVLHWCGTVHRLPKADLNLNTR